MNYRQNKDLYKGLRENEILKARVNFGRSPQKLKSDYSDVYEGVYAEVISTDRFDEDTNFKYNLLRTSRHDQKYRGEGRGKFSYHSKRVY